MSTLDNPFQYPDKPPEWFLELARAKRRAKRSKKLGRPIGSWGGRRPGAGRPKEKTEEAATFTLNSLQKKMLTEMGNGDINKGIQALIDQYL